MTFKNGLKLFWGNTKRYVKNVLSPLAVTKESSGIILANVLLFYVPFLPILLPLALLGAIVKTVVDISTRKPLPEEKINNLVEIVAGKSNDEINDLSDKLKLLMDEKKPMSESSRKMHNALLGKEYKNPEVLNEKSRSITSKRIEIILKQEKEKDGKDAPKTLKELKDIYQDKYIYEKYLFTGENRKQLIDFTKYTNEYSSCIIKNNKADKNRSEIIHFVKNEMNNGKHSLHVILNLFNENKDNNIQENMHEANSLQMK